MGKNDEFVPHGALLKCSEGATPSPLSVTSQFMMRLQRRRIATEKDHLPMVNIMPFGICRRLSQMALGISIPCVPATDSAWKEVNQESKINEKRTLLGKSTCKCKVGGTISIVLTTQINQPVRGKVSKKSNKYHAEVKVPCDRYPESSRHIKDWQRKNPPGNIMTFDPANAKDNRRSLRARMKEYSIDKGQHRDEWPMAMFREGGNKITTSIRPIDGRDNSGSGRYIRSAMDTEMNKKHGRLAQPGDKIKVSVDCSVGCGLANC
jgi:hypothetical protein